MRKVFENPDFTLVGHFQSILESAGIATDLRNVGSAIDGSVFSTDPAIPALWVVEDGAYDEAIALLASFLRPVPEQLRSDWICPGCGETIEKAFDRCWKCGSESPDDRSV
jgi:hypothetical protein